MGAPQELVQKNTQLVAVARQLGGDAERDKAALRAELEADSAKQAQRFAQQIGQQRSEREQQGVRPAPLRFHASLLPVFRPEHIPNIAQEVSFADGSCSHRKTVCSMPLTDTRGSRQQVLPSYVGVRFAY